MLENVTYVRSTRQSIRDAIMSLPTKVRHQVSDAMMARAGLAILKHIQGAFLTKSQGGTDEAGDSWAPLKPATVAYSRFRYGRSGPRTKREKSRGAHPSQALTDRQRERWWQLYGKGMGIFKGDKGAAARYAWSVSKREGVKTLLDKYGGRKVPILYNTGELFNSIHVGRASMAEVAIKTNHKAATAHHNGAPARGLPQRRLWPKPENWPDSWWKSVTDEIQRGIMEIAAQAIKESSSRGSFYDRE